MRPTPDPQRHCTGRETPALASLEPSRRLCHTQSMLRLLVPIAIAAGLLAACAPEAPPGDTAPPEAAAGWLAEPTPPALASRRVFQLQLAVAADGTLLQVWREKGEKGSDLYLSRRPVGGVSSEPVRINDLPGSVQSWNHDESRASVAPGPGGRVAVAWTTGSGNVRVAISADGGASFAPSMRLNQDEKPAYHGFPTLAFDTEGVLHAAWIDARDAPQAGAEEPADLYSARLTEGAIDERNLTADRDDSVCGCCLPHMEMAGDRLTIAFRNATADGYRDIFRVAGTTGGAFTTAERLGPPMWKLNGCPSAGPMTVDGITLWNEVSTGKQRTLAAAAGGAYRIVLDGTDGSVRLPPRRVANSSGGDALVLVPGSPHGTIFRAADGAWSPAVEDLPEWVTSAALDGDRLLLAGDVDGQARFASRRFQPAWS